MRHVDEVITALDGYGGPIQSWLVGEPCFDPPIQLAEALARAAHLRNFGYPPQPGLPELRETLAARHSEYGSEIEPNQVTVTSGAKGALLALFATLLEPGDELIHPAPCYPAYPIMARRFGARPIAVPEHGDGFAGWTANVASKISRRTRAVVLASPSNPTGTTLSSTVVTELVDLCRTRGIRLIFDEAYDDFRFGADKSVLPSDSDPDRTTVIQIRSASKSWALCSWRVGWLVADAPLAARVARSHASLVNPASGPAQAALCALPEVPVDYIDSARAAVHHRMVELCTSLNNAGLAIEEPEGGFYLWLKVGERSAADGFDRVADWCSDLALHHGLGLWPGEDFGDPEHVRIAVTSPAQDVWGAAVSYLTEKMGR